MKFFFIPLLICISHFSFSQAANNLSWYKMLTGKIDRYPVTLHLHKAGRQYRGYYYYDARQQPVYFSGEDSSLKGKIKLVAFTQPDNDEEFIFSLSQSKASGSWKKNAKAPPVSFTAMESKATPGFLYVFTKGGVVLRPKMKDSPAAGYEAASVWPMGNSSSEDFLKQLIRKAFDEKATGNEDIGALFLKEKKSFFAGYLEEHRQTGDLEIKEAPSVYTLEQSGNMMIAYRTSKMLNLALSTYSYTGGAHGNYGTSFICTDLVRNKKLVLTDVLNEQGQKMLGSLLEKYFRKNNQLQPADSLQEAGLFENFIKPTDNFYATVKGLCFNYTPYEIGPYAMGEISIFIPLHELENYLLPAFKSLLF